MKYPRATTRITREVQVLAAAWGLPPSMALQEAAALVAEMPLTWRTASELRLWAQRVKAGSDSQDVVFVTRARQAMLLQEGSWRTRAGVLLPFLEQLLTARLEHGFPLPPLPCTREEALSSLREGKSKMAARFLRASFPSFWAADDGPSGWAADDPRWHVVLCDRAGANKRGETFDLTWDELRRGLRVQRNVVSFFQPAHAYALYQELLGDTTDPRVWDPSCGFGARLLGFFAAYPGGTYCGNEPAALTYADLQRLAKGLSVDLRQAGSETGDTPEGPFDLVFTSPPYFDKERYFNEPSQSWVLFPSREEWLTGFLFTTMSTAVQRLRRGGRLALNVDWDLYAEVEELGSRLLLQREPDKLLPVRKHHFTKKGRANEPILVWRKG